MEDIYINNTSQNNSYNCSNTNNSDHSNSTVGHYDDVIFIIDVLTCITICIGLPLILMAIYALYSMLRNDHVAPIYVINLLITDLIQFCCMIIEVVRPKDSDIMYIFQCIYVYCQGVGVGFMVCVALERYLLIVWPLWYHCRRTIKSSVVVCVMVWALSSFILLTTLFQNYIHVYILFIMFAVLSLHPFPLLIFFLVGTLKALSSSISVSSDEKRRVVGTLVLVLLIYMLLFLPCSVWYIVNAVSHYKELDYISYDPLLDDDIADDLFGLLSSMFLQLNPLADLVLYVFMRKGTIDKLLASVCCCRMDSNEISSSAV